ncbi:hypothetical protein [Halalkalicoccus tibetensis]|uniref:Uncharacterized protein n=1 Tax=Halalkalicoccus tibetensis TaxID=175632 RepID=A0ABD5VB24_9EURY
MQYPSIEHWIRVENERQTSVDDQVTTASWLYERAYTAPNERQIRRRELKEEIGDRLDHTLKTILDNLLEIGVIEKMTLPGAQAFVLHERTGKSFFGVQSSQNEIQVLLNEEVSRLLADIREQNRPPRVSATADGGTIEGDSSVTLREFVADTLDIPPESVESELTAIDETNEDLDATFDRMTQFDAVVAAIKDSDEFSRQKNYDQMGWRNRAHRWTLSEQAVRVEAQGQA